MVSFVCFLFLGYQTQYFRFCFVSLNLRVLDFVKLLYTDNLLNLRLFAYLFRVIKKDAGDFESVHLLKFSHQPNRVLVFY